MGMKLTITQTVNNVRVTMDKKVIHIDKNLPVQFAPASSSNSEVLLTTRNLTDDDLFTQFFNPSGANRDVVLPDESYRNHAFIITNTASATYLLTVKDFALATVGTIAAGESRFFISDGLKWVMLTVTPNSVFTTKGDLLVATGPAASDRLGVGTNGQLLVASSSEATGIRWIDRDGGVDIMLGNGVDVLTTGLSLGAWCIAKYDFFVEQITMLANTTGSVQVSPIFCTYANFVNLYTLPSVYTSLYNSTISSATKVQQYQDFLVPKGSLIGLYIQSCSNITQLLVSIEGRVIATS